MVFFFITVITNIQNSMNADKLMWVNLICTYQSSLNELHCSKMSNMTHDQTL